MNAYHFMRRTLRRPSVRPMQFMRLLPLMLLSLCSVAHAVPKIGELTYVHGDVFVQPTGAARHAAVQGAELANGDTIQTGSNGEAVLEFADHQKTYLKNRTLYRIDDYHFSPDTAVGNHSMTSLLKGGLRAISGLIGHQGDPNAYQLKTQSATIGIRGTEWSVLDSDGTGDTSDSTTTRGSHNFSPVPQESIVVLRGAIDVNTGTYHDLITAGSGTILRPKQSWMVILPASELPVVTPSAGAAPSCQ